MNEYTLWLLISYVAGSAVTGYMVSKAKQLDMIDAVVDTLINQGYIKTKGHGEDMELIKHTDWNNNG